MTDSLTRMLRDNLGELVIGGPLFDPHGNLSNMVVYPIFPSDLGPDFPHLVTLTEGLHRGVSLSDTGMVSQVHVDNPLPAPIFVGESDILLGATQLRSVQFSCLVPPQQRASLPVSCVEAGQPTVYEAPFTDADACPWFVRSFKLEQLARHGEPHQHRIWERIKDYLQHTGTTSSTQDVRAVFRTHGRDVANLSENFLLSPGQTGAIFAVGHDLFFELFSEPELLEDRYDQTLRSAIIEAIAHPGDKVAPAEQVSRLFDHILSASVNSRVVQNRSIRDNGRTVVFSERGVSGSALMADSKIVHLSGHKRCWGEALPFSDQLHELEENRASWQMEGKALEDRLRRDYGKRRKRYRSFKGNLVPAARKDNLSQDSPYEKVHATEEGASPNPLPLSASIHKFFLTLFRKQSR